MRTSMGGDRCFTACSLHQKPSEISDFDLITLLIELSMYVQLILTLIGTYTDSRNAHAEFSNT